MSWFNKLVAQTLPAVPKPIVRRVSSRYIAGETLEEALDSVRFLNRQNVTATLDILGEFVATRDEAEGTSDDYVNALAAIQREEVNTNVSLKLTQLGLKVDLEFCYSMTRRVVEAAVKQGNFVRIDMEDATCTEDTLQIFRRLHAEFPKHVGCVIQAYLRRSEGDIRGLVEMGANVRLCKGIYIEPRTLAFRDPGEINRSYMNLLTLLLEGGVYAAIATHDDELVRLSYDLIQKLKLTPQQYEFQMLLGVREPLRRSIVDQGHRLRVYVPYGPHWYAYSLRRLKENPEVAGYVMKGFLNGG